MARGFERWSTGSGDETVWWARVWIAPKQYIVVDKAEYEKKRYAPPFWQVTRLRENCSGSVRRGMVKFCADYAARVAPLGFMKTKSRFWARENEHTVESIRLFRLGSYCGAPISPSISLRVELGIHVLNDPSRVATIGTRVDDVRKPDGRSYHNRFNAETWSTYDLCLDDLTLLTTEFAEPWFATWRDPKALLDYPDLPAPTRPLLEEAINGQVNPDYVAFALRQCGVKKSRLNRRVA